MDPNVWAVLAGVFVIVGLSDRLMLRAVRSEVRATQVEIKCVEQKLDTQVGGLAAVVDARLKALEGDMSLVKAHLLGVHQASEDSRAGA